MIHFLNFSWRALVIEPCKSSPGIHCIHQNAIPEAEIPWTSLDFFRIQFSWWKDAACFRKKLCQYTNIVLIMWVVATSSSSCCASCFRCSALVNSLNSKALGQWSHVMHKITQSEGLKTSIHSSLRNLGTETHDTHWWAINSKPHYPELQLSEPPKFHLPIEKPQWPDTAIMVGYEHLLTNQDEPW